MRLLIQSTVCFALSVAILLGWTSSVWAESSAQSMHWGALAFPDHDRTLEVGFTTDRFTEFDGAGKRYNDIQQTDGFNFWSLSWTERLERLKGWNTNLTVGAGPTQDRFSRYLQNDVVHKFRGLTPVPVGAVRDATDFMISGTVTNGRDSSGAMMYFSMVSAGRQGRCTMSPMLRSALDGCLYWSSCLLCLTTYASPHWRVTAAPSAEPHFTKSPTIPTLGRLPSGSVTTGEKTATPLGKSRSPSLWIQACFWTIAAILWKNDS